MRWSPRGGTNATSLFTSASAVSVSEGPLFGCHRYLPSGSRVGRSSATGPRAPYPHSFRAFECRAAAHKFVYGRATLTLYSGEGTPPASSMLRSSASWADSSTQSAVYVNAFGTDMATWTAASPLTHVTPGAGIGSFLIARRGNAARQAAANAFRDALTGAGVAVRVEDVSVYDHEGVNDAVGRPGETVLTPALRAFFAACLP